MIIVASFFASGQGSISGIVKDSKTGETVVGANVVIQGTITGASTDIDGNFLINNLEVGTYTLQVSYVAYKTHIIPNVVVETAKRTVLDIQLAEDVSELAEIVVAAKSHTDTDYDVVRAMRLTKVIVSGISSEQISKSLDRDAAAVVRRIPGVTVKDNQFIVIRGLSERYNAVMLNNAYAPSVETDIRSFSFAVIPSSQLDKILVFKSPSADLPGDFGGGVVKVVTKSTPGENSLVFDYSTQVRLGTTFGDFYHQKKDPFHATGFNTGYYDLPASIPNDISTLQQGGDRANAGRQLKNLWTEQKSMAIPDQRFAITSNRNFRIGSVEVGNITAINYSNSYSTFNIQRADYTVSGNARPTFEYQDKQYNQQIRTGAISNWSFKLNANHQIEFKNLYNQSSSDQFVNRNGVEGSLSGTGGQHNRSFDKIYRGIYSGQLNGTHELFAKKTSIEWVAAYSNSYRDQPDYKRYRTVQDGNGNERITVHNSVDPNNLGRFYSNMNESTYSGGFSVKQQLNLFDNPLHNPELKAGVFFENKSRSFKARNIGYEQSARFNSDLAFLPVGQLFQTQNINNTTGINLDEASSKSNSYSAANDLLAYYAMASIPFGDKIKLDGGVRVEDNLQSLRGYNFSQQYSPANNHILSVLPSANLSFNFTEKSLVRAAYGQSLNRPEFRELAGFTYYDFNLNLIYVGNNTLKTARINNFDLRYEWYPSKTEMVTAGFFYKDFSNPIEVIIDPNSIDPRNVNFFNPDKAKSYGVEVEAKKSLYGLTGMRVIDNLSVMLNASLI